MRLVKPQKEETFEDWAVEKYKEVEKRINFCSENGTVDPVRLNEVLTTFAGHFLWSMTVAEVEENKLNMMRHEYDNWYKTQYNATVRVCQAETAGSRAPSQATVEARIVDICGDEILALKKSIENQASRVSLMKGIVRVLEKQANILQTLSSNMRSELYYTTGYRVVGRVDEKSRNDAAKSIMKQALASEDS